MIKVGIVGGTGYTGVELLRILALHPHVEVTVVTSRADTGVAVTTVYPNLHGHYAGLCFSAPDIKTLSQCELIFFATPNGIAMQMAAELLNSGIKVIDLSADFRLQNVAEWEQWYDMTHVSPELIPQAVYGLPELNREQIKTSNLIACAGCYPTAVQLGLIPLITAGLIQLDNIIADVKSGVSGAGRKATVSSLMSETGESLKAYAVSGHRHLPEIIQGLSVVAKSAVNLTFVPHLIPMIRGIHATLYAQSTADLNTIYDLYQTHYQHEPFVTILPPNTQPNTRNVKGSNQCQISLFKPQGADTVVILVVIDNLIKGAAGQAVQNLNLIYGFDETTALKTLALYP